MFQENLPPQKSLESVSVPTASLGLQHLLLGLLQYFLTFDLSLFSLICRNGYFKKPDLFSSFAYTVALYEHRFQYKGVNVSLGQLVHSCLLTRLTVVVPQCLYTVGSEISKIRLHSLAL